MSLPSPSAQSADAIRQPASYLQSQLRFLPVPAFAPAPDAWLDIYLYDSLQLDPERLAELARDYLHPREQAVFARRKHTQAQQEFIASRCLLKAYVSKYFAYNYRDLAVLFDEQSRCLQLIHAGQALPISCCISHSHGQLLLAISMSPLAQLGVDLEHCSTRRSLSKLANRYYHKQELQACAQMPERSLYRIWTLKEALAKALKRPLAELLRENIFSHCANLNVASADYIDFDISVICSGTQADTAPNIPAVQLLQLGFTQGLIDQIQAANKP